MLARNLALFLLPLAAACQSPSEPASEGPEPAETLTYSERHELCELQDHERRSIYIQFIRLADKYGENIARQGTADGRLITTNCLDLIVVRAMNENPEWTPSL